jgi:hypothetical protein
MGVESERPGARMRSQTSPGTVSWRMPALGCVTVFVVHADRRVQAI